MIIFTSVRLIRHLKVNGPQHVGITKYTIRIMENIIGLLLNTIFLDELGFYYWF